jgi:coenzyme F420-0:L-glutamate ligase/coenzyme F420-1:gamma-L-glutamate ligase
MLLTPLPGIPLIQPGDNLASLILTALVRANLQLAPDDILVLAQKIVSKAEGRLVNLSTMIPSPRAEELALQAEKDPRLVELILRESREVLRVRPGTIIVEHRLGFVCASAGIDHSNVEGIPNSTDEAVTTHTSEGVRSDDFSRPGQMAKIPASGNSDDWMLLLPEDPDASAARIRQQLEAASGARIGVLMPGLVDMRGQPDLFGYHLQITLIAAADELAAAASLVMGQAAEGTPVVHVRGFPYPLCEGSLKELLRPHDQDMFR